MRLQGTEFCATYVKKHANACDVHPPFWTAALSPSGLLGGIYEVNAFADKTTASLISQLLLKLSFSKQILMKFMFFSYPNVNTFMDM